MLVNQPTTKTTRKVKASSLGATAGAPVGLLVAWGIAAATGVQVDEETGNLIYAVAATGAAGIGAWLSGWWTRERG